MTKPNREHIRELAEKWLKGTITPEERMLLDQWYEAEYEGPLAWKGDDPDEESLRRRMYLQLQNRIDEQPDRKISGQTGFVRYAAAAAILLFALAGGWYLYDYEPETGSQAQLAESNIAPGGNKATLTLADGRRIDLSSDKEGIVAGANELSYNDGTEIIANKTGESGLAEPLNYQLTTPMGGQYQVTLPDSTKVWLNAASRLIYPAAFSEDKREVRLLGEAYFEVTRDESRPFRVITPDQQIEVLGTSFNITAYPEEKESRTTLISGSVRVSAGGQSRGLKVGQQAVLSGGEFRVSQADIEAVTAWKSGLFLFNDEPLERIMHRIARWYDADVVYREGVNRKIRLWGGISRYNQVETVLDRLETAGNVRFKIEGRRIIVSMKK